MTLVEILVLNGSWNEERQQLLSTIAELIKVGNGLGFGICIVMGDSR